MWGYTCFGYECYFSWCLPKNFSWQSIDARIWECHGDTKASGNPIWASLFYFSSSSGGVYKYAGYRAVLTEK